MLRVYTHVCICMCVYDFSYYLLLHCPLILVFLLVGFVTTILLLPNHLQTTIVYCIYVYVNCSLLYHILCLLFC